ncbi:lysosome membrane protein 2-like isoform X2 [Orbicella faveolata]|uniref:lysosome membrane protein 2-like isoform X2 n=1 Tax=Orbicella faveolata TaxID=48498 RepID=UPI0009E335BC|nr:lysosome membrane protein 2-like isoform X2 [Orbicella faveolata]
MASKRGCCSCCSRRALIIGFAVSGTFLLLLGLLLSVGGVGSFMIKRQIEKKVQLKPGGLVFKEWKRPSVPIFMQYFVFNLTNPDEVFAGTSIPSVTQMGPYSYREIRSNDVANWTKDDSVVTFMPNRTYIFDPDTSCAGCNDKDDTFVTVNIPLLAVALWIRNTNYREEQKDCFDFIQIAANEDGVKLFQRKSVFELLWGYNDTFLADLVDASKLPPPFPQCPGPEGGLTDFVQLQYNNTYYGISAVNTGQSDISRLEQFTMWRGQTHLSWWSDEYANMINGTDGTQFSPDVSKDDILYIFSPDICRSGYLRYDSEVTEKRIKLYRFTIPEEMYLSGDVYSPNKGFCVSPGCLPTGLLNVSLCQPMNPPVVMSPPHFYQSNKSLLETVNGLHPMKSAHQTLLDVEPLTGIVMRAAKRLQVNIALEPVDTFNQTSGKFKPVFLPVMFANESALITDQKAAEFRHQVYLPIKLTEVVQYVLIALGSLFLIEAFALLLPPNKITKMCCGSEDDRDDAEKKPLVYKR